MKVKQNICVNTKRVYSTKAKKYAKYRWDYAPGAIAAIFEIAQLSVNSSIAELGAGTGILTKHFAEKVKRVYAVEPNWELRKILSNDLGSLPSVSVLDSSAEETKLADDSMDLIAVAQAIHWFDPIPAKREMARILKKNGWLAILRNFGTDKNLNKALVSLMSEEYGANFSVVQERPKEKPIDFYFGNDDFVKKTYAFQFRQSWEEFMGALTTASYMPDEDHLYYGKLATKAKEIYDQYRVDGTLVIEGETELIIGQLSR